MASSFTGNSRAEPWVIGNTPPPADNGRPDPPAFRYLLAASTCFGCKAGMPSSARCTVDLGALRLATIDDLLHATGPAAAACAQDRDQEIGRRLDYPVSTTTTRRPGLLARLFRKRTP